MRISASQKRFFDNVVLIAALRLIFTTLEQAGVPIHLLGQVAETTSGGTPDRQYSSYYGGDIPWIKSGDLNDGLIEECEEYITEEGLKNSSAKIYPKGTLVVALYGATVGKTGILTFNSASNQAVCAITPLNSSAMNEFLFWFLRYKRPDFLNSSFGGAQPNISQKVLRETLLPLPPTELQEKICAYLKIIESRQRGAKNLIPPILPEPLAKVNRIVARIEELAEKIEEARGLRREASEETNALLDASVNNIFQGIESISAKPLAQLTSKIGSGSTPPGGRSNYPSSGIPFIRSLNVRMRRFTWTDVVFIDQETHENMKGTKVKPNDVLLNITGASIGRVACAPNDLVEANVNQHVAIIRPLADLDSRYLMYWLSQPKIQSFINDKQKGATRQGFTKAQIEALLIPFPSLSDQRNVAAHLDALQARVDSLKRMQAESSAELDALLPSILDKAFRGEL
jgi:type I restriction enzyme S subunit